MRTYPYEEMKRFNYLTGEINAVYHAIARRLGLPDSEMQILYTIVDNGNVCPQSRIVRLTGLCKQTLNSALRRMEAQELIVTEAAGTRGRNVRLTENGMRLAEQTAVKVMEAERAAFDGWSVQEVETYLALTEKFLTAFGEKARLL